MNHLLSHRPRHRLSPLSVSTMEGDFLVPSIVMDSLSDELGTGESSEPVSLAQIEQPDEPGESIVVPVSDKLTQSRGWSNTMNKEQLFAAALSKNIPVSVTDSRKNILKALYDALAAEQLG